MDGAITTREAIRRAELPGRCLLATVLAATRVTACMAVAAVVVVLAHGDATSGPAAVAAAAGAVLDPVRAALSGPGLPTASPFLAAAVAFQAWALLRTESGSGWSLALAPVLVLSAGAMATAAAMAMFGAAPSVALPMTLTMSLLTLATSRVPRRDGLARVPSSAAPLGARGATPGDRRARP